MPGEALLVERDDHLWTFDVSLLSWDQVSLVRVLPDYSKPKERGGKCGEANRGEEKEERKPLG